MNLVGKGRSAVVGGGRGGMNWLQRRRSGYFVSATLILQTSYCLMELQLNLGNAIWWKPGPREPLGPVSALPTQNGNAKSQRRLRTIL